MTWPVPSKVDTQLCKQDAFDEKDCDMPLCKDGKYFHITVNYAYLLQMIPDGTNLSSGYAYPLSTAMADPVLGH